MSLLICRPVSRNSNPEKIDRWIERLEGLREKHSGEDETVRFLDRMLSQANDWLSVAPES